MPKPKPIVKKGKVFATTRVERKLQESEGSVTESEIEYDEEEVDMEVEEEKQSQDYEPEQTELAKEPSEEYYSEDSQVEVDLPMTQHVPHRNDSSLDLGSDDQVSDKGEILLMSQ